MCAVLQGQDDGTSCVHVEEYLETRDGEKPLGVYALYNAHNAVQYVGYSRNMVLAVKVRLSCLMLRHNCTWAQHQNGGTNNVQHCPHQINVVGLHWTT